MATKLNETSKGILGKASEKIGSYQESTGGGTPLKKGQKLKDHPEAHRVQQPRDEDGQFTYNSVNGKGLKYGPSRGTTVPPFLRGIKLTYCVPGTKLKIEGDDGIKVKIMTIDMTVEELVNACKYYIDSEEGFAGLGKGSSITKMGRKSKEEKEAKSGQIGNADTKTFSEGTQKKMDDAKAEYEKSNSAQEVNPFIKNGPFVHPNGQAGYQVKTDTLNEDGTVTPSGSAKYNKWYKQNAPQQQQEPEKENKPSYNVEPEESKQPQEKNNVYVSPEGKKVNQEDVLKQMGLNGDDKEFDVETIKKDPKAYMKTPEFKSIWKNVPKDSGIKAGKVIKLIAMGKFKNPGQVKKWLSKKLGK